jgi:hypothetical protein
MAAVHGSGTLVVVWDSATMEVGVKEVLTVT